ncbi:DNA-binding response regulator [Bifidobacterium ramosum]|uniref:Response regulator n=1 Tax=Bifidobacterium ramosum TaxID=1798158 RepID=A0A6L4X5D0_9BIFI|nr:response regulator transcription factor [Bifidobacterium ramosum]KAB8289397.1 DNA-binding response regulator [Bifidobacterium ramosum]NEG71096.1 response regulator [Bifidobacterium ramosum]
MQTRETDTPVTVGMIDNDTLTLGALRALLARMNGVDVTWASDDGNHAIDLCRDPHTRPDVLLVDMSMEPLPGTEVCRRIRAAGLAIGLVCITSFTLHTYAAQAARAGAQAIVSKTDLPGIRNAILHAAHGKASPSPIAGVAFHDVDTTDSGAAIDATSNGTTTGRIGATSPAATVTDSVTTMPSTRELQIIRMLADGMETDAISQSLSLSRYTIATYLKRACDKLGACNRTNLIAICERRGLL